MKWTEIPSGQTNGAFQRFMVALGDEADVAVGRINAEPVFADRMAAYARNGGIEISTSQASARAIMGKNFFGVEEAIKHFEVNPLKRQLAYLAEIPYSEATLTACKDTHILVAFFPNAVLDIRAKTARVKLPKDQKSLFYEQDWYENEKETFARDRGQLDWYLVRKTPVTDSTSKTWAQQQDLLDKKIDQTPEAQVMVYTIIGHFLATGERLFEKVWVRTANLDSDGDRVYVVFDAGGLYLYYRWDDRADDDIGLAASRKSES